MSCDRYGCVLYAVFEHDWRVLRSSGQESSQTRRTLRLKILLIALETDELIRVEYILVVVSETRLTIHSKSDGIAVESLSLSPFTVHPKHPLV